MTEKDQSSGGPESAVANSVLVVDDEPIIVRRLAALLERLGYRVAAFTDSDLALAELGRRGFEFVITDLKMRKNDGLKIVARAGSRDPACQVIVITGLGNGLHVGAALRAGAAACLSKPFRIEELKNTLERLRDRREPRRLVA